MIACEKANKYIINYSISDYKQRQTKLVHSNLHFHNYQVIILLQ